MFTRAFQSDLTVRGDGRTVYGFAVPFGVEAIVNDGYGNYVERFTRGAFKNVVKDHARVQFRYQHDDDLLAWIGNAALLREEERGLYGEWRLDSSERGKQAAYKIADGQLPGLSISFIPAKDEVDVKQGMQRVTRKLVKQLDHVAAVRTPAYQTGEPLMVRARATPESSVDHWRTWRASVMVQGEQRT